MTFLKTVVGRNNWNCLRYTDNANFNMTAVWVNMRNRDREKKEG
jgi:hypothetical protein